MKTRTLAGFLGLLLCAGSTAYAGGESLPSSGKEIKTTADVAEVAETFSWTGFYAGLHLGYGWHDGEIDSLLLPDDFFSIEPGTQSNDSDGITGGAQLGYNYQIGCFVLGAEADFSGADINGESHPDIVFVPAGVGGTQTFRHEIDWFGTVRGRIGCAPVPRLFVYGTGGFAYAHVDQTAGAINIAVNYQNSRSGTEVGFTGGGGAEYAIGRHWSIKAEYLYIDVGNSSVTAPAENPQVPFVVDYDWDNAFHNFTVGVNYRF